MKLVVSKMPNLKASQAGLNGFECSPMESWRMTEKVDHGNNYRACFYQEVRQSAHHYLI